MVCGGTNESYTVLDDCYAYDHDNGQFVKAGKLNISRSGAAAVAINATTLYITGGYTPGSNLKTTEYWTLSGGSSPGPDMPTTR